MFCPYVPANREHSVGEDLGTRLVCLLYSFRCLDRMQWWAR